MEMLVIEGGHPLRGEATISGSKNSTLPILCASLLSKDVSSISNVPNLADTRFLLSLLNSFGVETRLEGTTASIDARTITSSLAHYDMVRKMRASILVLAPLLARMGEARVSLPGGCAIGSRPVDIHLQGLQALGAHIVVEDGYIHARLEKGHFVGNEFSLPMPSVGATEQLVMAAVLAQGTSVLHNVAREPEVVDLCTALNQAGAKISGIGNATLEINGVSSLKALSCRIKPDRIEAGTFIAIAAATKSTITLKEVFVPDIANIMERFSHTGMKFNAHPSKVEGYFDIEVIAPKQLVATDVETATYPGFPTDMQAQFMAAMTLAKGTSKIYEKIFENRMMHVPELNRMGADITIEKGLAVVKGKEKLQGAPVMATDLRASASLVIAALAAEGRSEIRRVYHLDRGYEELEKKLAKLGAHIKRMKQE